MFFTNLVFSMGSLRGRFVATIFVIRFFPQKLFGKIDWKIGWKIWMENLLENWLENCVGKLCWKIVLENLDGKLFGNVGWKIVLENLAGNVWLEMLVEHLAGNVWLEMLVEHLAGKMLVNGCEIIGEKIVASNLPLRLSTTHKDSQTFKNSRRIDIQTSSQEGIRTSKNVPKTYLKHLTSGGIWKTRVIKTSLVFFHPGSPLRTNLYLLAHGNQ